MQKLDEEPQRFRIAVWKRLVRRWKVGLEGEAVRGWAEALEFFESLLGFLNGWDMAYGNPP